MSTKIIQDRLDSYQCKTALEEERMTSVNYNLS